jgi:hypothetical protein
MPRISSGLRLLSCGGGGGAAAAAAAAAACVLLADKLRTRACVESTGVSREQMRWAVLPMHMAA